MNSDHSDINLLYLNIRSIRKKMDEIQALVLRKNCDIIVLNEIWIKSNEAPYYNLNNFTPIFNCRDHSEGGGCAIFVRNNIPFNIVNIIEEFNIIVIEVVLNKKSYKIATAYRPPSTRPSEFCESLRKYVLLNSEVFFIGDINLNILEPNLQVKRYMDLVISSGFQFLNSTNPTRMVSNCCTLIDHILSNFHQGGVNCNILLEDTPISDHKMLTVNIGLPKIIKSALIEKEFKRLNRAMFYQKVESKLSTLTEINIENLVTIISQSKDEATTVMKKKIREEAKNWITPDILKVMKQRDKMFHKAKLFPNRIAASGRTWNEIYTQLSKQVTLMVRQAKQESLESKLSATGQDSRKLWRALNEEISGGQRCIGRIETITDMSGAEIKGDVPISNCFNHFFTNINETQPSFNGERVRNHINPKSIFISPVTHNDVKNKILSLKNDSAPGYDGITSQDLKTIVDIIAEPLSICFNDHITQGTFPSCLKRGQIVPIFKAGDKKQMLNYRPITILSSISKVFEKILDEKLRKFVEAEIKFDEKQFGFQSQSGTESALMDTCHTLNTILDKGLYAVEVFIDLKKAFDLVDHECLLLTLEELGVRGIALNLFRSYLTERVTNTKLNGVLSDDSVVKSGVPQGSVLGPTLFLLFVHNIQRAGLKGEYTVFADDTSLIYSADSASELESTINNDLEKLLKWVNGNKLVVNTSKTNFMVFKQINKSDINISLKLNNVDIERVQQCKYLGMIIDENLSWSKHVDKIVNKISGLTGAFRKCGKFPDNICTMLYNAHIMAPIRYNLPIWSQCTEGQKHRIQVAMNGCLKALFKFDWYTSTNTLLCKTRSFSLNETIEIERSKLIYKIENKKMKTSMKIRKPSDIHNYNLRNRNQIRNESSRTRRLLHGVLNESISSFNSLPPDLQSSRSVQHFNKHLKNHVLAIRPN